MDFALNFDLLYHFLYLGSYPYINFIWIMRQVSNRGGGVQFLVMQYRRVSVFLELEHKMNPIAPLFYQLSTGVNVLKHKNTLKV